ncbi:unnamed protein product [Mycena citricolor]|uniref:Uncharacterized protein n=1 Tax=Mycena citricolor TaxID=2018698 RepID=A0AAD2Q6A6_9AGAR|nr:unnamed protein product [Mycena citricolor]
MLGLGGEKQMAAQIWRAMEDGYGKSTIAGRLVAENAWNACKLEKYLNNKDPVKAYVNAKFLAWCDFTSQGAVNNERTYIAGLVAGLSSEFIPIIPMIINAATPIEAHQITKSFKSVVNIVGGVTPSSTVMATNAAAVPVTCSNCKKRGHTIEKCWSKGGGRKGQAPAWFGRRGGNQNGDGGSGGNQDVTTSMNVIALHAVASLATCDTTLDNAGFPEAPDLIDGVDMGNRPEIFVATANPMVYSVVGQVVPTYLDSGTSDHCFTNRSDFSSYVPQSRTGQAAPVGEAGTFKILGKGTVIKEFMVNGGNKLGVQVLDGVMVGYLGGDSGYRILTNGGKVVAAGDVIFEHGNPHRTLANVDAPTDNDLAPPPTAISPSTAPTAKTSASSSVLPADQIATTPPLVSLPEAGPDAMPPLPTIIAEPALPPHRSGRSAHASHRAIKSRESEARVAADAQAGRDYALEEAQPRCRKVQG